MIASRQILDLFEEVIYRKVSSIWKNNEMPVSNNASHWSHSMIDLKEFTRTREFRKESRLRFILYLPTLESYVWCAYQATHMEMSKHYLSGSTKDVIFGIIDVNRKVFCVDTFSPLWGKSTFDPYKQEAEEQQKRPEWIKGIDWLRTYLSGLNYTKMSY
jgi:hypothetical protein